MERVPKLLETNLLRPHPSPNTLSGEIRDAAEMNSPERPPSLAKTYLLWSFPRRLFCLSVCHLSWGLECIHCDSSWRFRPNICQLGRGVEGTLFLGSKDSIQGVLHIPPPQVNSSARNLQNISFALALSFPQALSPSKYLHLCLHLPAGVIPQGGKCCSFPLISISLKNLHF